MALGPVMLDVEGLSLTPADRTLLRETSVGGVILFSRNYESPVQLAGLVQEIRAVRSPPLLVAVDHEGGRVQRFRDGFTAIPSMRRLGRLYDENSDGAIELASTCGWLIGSGSICVLHRALTSTGASARLLAIVRSTRIPILLRYWRVRCAAACVMRGWRPLPSIFLVMGP